MWRLGMLTMVVLTFAVVIYSNRVEISNWALLFVPIHTENIEFGERTLIIAPHPDDETLGGANIIQKALKGGKSIKVVLFTTGDGYRKAVQNNLSIKVPTGKDFQRLGMLRHQETLSALEFLGLKEKDVFFLGYPDGGMNGLWERDWDCTHLHHGLNGSDHSPYPFSYELKAPYCGKNVVKNLSKIIEDYQPTDILYPDPHDHHHDHWATGAFTKYVIEKNNIPVNEWTYLVHLRGFPYPWSYKPELPLRPPQRLEGMDTTWHYLKASKEEETKKYEAIKKYGTQTKVMENYLSGFARKNDLLGTYHDPFLSDHAQFIFTDPLADSIIRGHSPDADLLKVGAYAANDKFYMGLTTKERIEPTIQYNFHLRFFSSGEVKRVDMSIKGHHVKISKEAQNSITGLHSHIQIKQNNQLWISFPAEQILPIEGFMISVSTVYDHHPVDRTAWRYVQMK